MVPSAVVQLQRSSWSAPVLRKVADVGNTHYGVHESLNLLGNSLICKKLADDNCSSTQISTCDLFLEAHSKQFINLAST